MCAAALVQSLGRVVFGAHDVKRGGLGEPSISQPIDPPTTT